MAKKSNPVPEQALEELSECLLANTEETYQYVKSVCEHFFEQNSESEKQLSSRKFQVLERELGKELCTIDEEELRSLLNA